MSAKKNPHAVALGRLGGKVGGRARSEAKTAAARANAKRPRPGARMRLCPVHGRCRGCAASDPPAS